MERSMAVAPPILQQSGDSRLLNEDSLFPVTSPYFEDSLHPETILKKSDYALPIIVDDNDIIGFDLSWRKIEFLEEDIELCSILYPLIDGQTTLGDIAKYSGLEQEKVFDFLQFLFKIAAVDNISTENVPAISFHDYIASLGRMLKQQLLDRVDLIPDDRSQISKKLLIGYLIETFHVVSSSSNHMSQIIAHTTSGRLRFLMTSYAHEEYLHGEMLKKGILASGIREEHLSHVFPLPETNGIINFIVNMARISPLWYGAFLAITEMPIGLPEVFNNRSKEWDMVEGLGVLPTEAFAPFREHDKIDLDARHGAHSVEFFLGKDIVSHEEQEFVRKNVIYYMKCLESAYSAIKAYYMNPDNPQLYEIR